MWARHKPRTEFGPERHLPVAGWLIACRPTLTNQSGKDPGIGFTVSAVTPALIDTDMTAAVPAKALERLRAAIPVRRIGRPDEWHGSSTSWRPTTRYITGQAWAVNGGLDM